MKKIIILLVTFFFLSNICSAQLAKYFEDIKKEYKEEIIYVKGNKIVLENDLHRKILLFSNNQCVVMIYIYKDNNLKHIAGLVDLINSISLFTKSKDNEGWTATVIGNNKIYPVYAFVDYHNACKQYSLVIILQDFIGTKI